MVNSVTSTAAEQSYAIAAQILSLTQQKLSGDIAMQLIQSAVSTTSASSGSGSEFQDPSTVTPEQLQSPIDIKI